MLDKNVFKQITELIEMAAELNEKGLASVVVYYNAGANLLEVTVYDVDFKTRLFKDICYLDWENDSSYGIDTMFPIFREKLQMMLREKAVC